MSHKKIVITTLGILLFGMGLYTVFHYRAFISSCVTSATAKPTESPWLAEVERKRPLISLMHNEDADIVIVGGGIAGVATAYFLLQETDKKIILLEANRVAHGATGHNAGQATSYFEKTLAKMIEEFGFEAAIAGQAAIESSWQLLTDIYQETQLKTPLYRFTGYIGCVLPEHLLFYLEENVQRVKGGLSPHTIYIANNPAILRQIPATYQAHYTIASQQHIRFLLATDSSQYIGAIGSPTGCLNSAAFTEELVDYLLHHFSQRFKVYEKSHVAHILLEQSIATLQVAQYQVQAHKVILCTNGFENFIIENKAGIPIDKKFHHMIGGRTAYMVAFLERADKKPSAIEYLTDKLMNSSATLEDLPYFYMTSRPFRYAYTKQAYSLLCVGGPDRMFPDNLTYQANMPIAEDIQRVLVDFVRQNYPHYQQSGRKVFLWHGLMGYTPNGMRRIGPEPCNPILLYNLGCNGVGILPSIYGGKKTAGFIKGQHFEPSVFHPADCRN